MCLSRIFFILDKHEDIPLYIIFNKFNLSKYPSKSEILCKKVAEGLTYHKLV